VLTPMHTLTAHVTDSTHDGPVNILWSGIADQYHMLWLACLTNSCEFHLYYDV